MNLLVSGPKYDMAPRAESPTVQQQLLSLCRACSKGINFDGGYMYICIYETSQGDLTRSSIRRAVISIASKFYEPL